MVSVYCAWCKAHISGPQTDDPDKISHGICKGCRKQQLKEVEKLRQPAPVEAGTERNSYER